MSQKTPNRDTIIEEIHRTRQHIAEKFGFDIAAILDDARKRQAASGHAIWQSSSSSDASDSAAKRPAG